VETVRSVKDQIRALSGEMLDIANSEQPAELKAATLRPQTVRLKVLQHELGNLEHVEQQVAVLRGAGASDDAGESSPWSGGLTGGYRLGNAPPLGLGEADLRSAHQAVLKGGRFRAQATVKAADPVTVSSGLGPAGFPQQILPPVMVLREQTRILDMIPSMSTDRPVIEWFLQTQAAVAAVVAEGGVKPQTQLLAPAQMTHATKIAGRIPATTESLQDFPAFAAFASADLVRAIIDAENDLLLNGTGNAPSQTVGLLNATGIYTQAYPATPPAGYNTLDAMVSAESTLRQGTAFATVRRWIMSPGTWAALRNLKDSQGRYLLDPAADAVAAMMVRGVEVSITTKIAAGTILGGDLAQAAQAFIRQGPIIEAYTGGTHLDALGAVVDNIATNIVQIVGEERLGMFAPRPAALIKLTGVPTA